MTALATKAPAAFETPFLSSLISLIRAEDSYGAWENRSDARLLEDFIVTRAEKREMPMMADPDPDTIDRVEKFYKAVGLAIERQSGLMASPMMKISHEGFGRVVLLVGRLVAFSKSLRDVHRFGFEDFDTLAAEGMKAVDQALAVIEKFPDVARA
ncbi:NifX-associated nitrogen fixation protein [Zavarzinia compransoris]|uniref:NifX-associated nitrogen fixation protein n=1 Tax=Zavarzinia marina TaxID=2911065 RepID=UPI001F2BF24B|nr:NifX-associated nitrogen fixation protein [Zavarzinia marina]MCF4164810.1 NifX-associated nitrogen fixation protein [Zavarzinia marina]